MKQSLKKLIKKSFIDLIKDDFLIGAYICNMLLYITSFLNINIEIIMLYNIILFPFLWVGFYIIKNLKK